MSRIKLELPAVFPFSTELEVRIGDINYGGHLGNDALLSLIHEARLRFLKSFGWTELDICGVGLIMSDCAIVYKSESFLGDRLKVEVVVTDVGKLSFDMLYRVSNVTSLKEVAQVKTGLLFFNYQIRETSPTPLQFREAFEPAIKQPE